MAIIKKTESQEITIPAMELNTFDLKIVGDTPMICHAWSEKAKLMILQKQQKKATTGKDVRNPAKEFAESLYWISEKPDLDKLTDEQIADAVAKGRFGFPTTAFKAAAIDGAYQSGAIEKKTTARGAFHILGEFAEIKGTPVMREDMVRIGMGTADLRYRAEFPEWETVLHLRFNAKAMSLEQIINMFNIGGFACGIGDWRPAKDGTYGQYHIG